MQKALASVVLVGAIVVPCHSLAQQPAWTTQLEGYIGWRNPLTEVTQVANGDQSSNGVELNPSLAFGGRVIFPLADAPSHHLGKVFVGLEGLGAFGADMKLASIDVVIGQADYYQLGVIVGMGKFIHATPVSLTLHGTLGLGVAHTTFKGNEEVGLAEDQSSVTSLLSNAALGLDLYLGSGVSVVTSASVNLGFGDPLVVSLVFLGGLALRLPTSGGTGY